jgi:hypothetical protein
LEKKVVVLFFRFSGSMGMGIAPVKQSLHSPFIIPFSSHAAAVTRWHDWASARAGSFAAKAMHA